MKRVLLVRHAQAESADTQGDDHARALTLLGRTHASALGVLITDQAIVPDYALVSDAVRARQTWQLMSKAIAPCEARVTGDVYEASTGAVHALLSQLPESVSTALVVGHEPTMSAAAHWLADDDALGEFTSQLSMGLKTGTAALLEYDGTWIELMRDSARLRGILDTRESA